MGMIRQCKLRRGTWYTVAWVPAEQAVVGHEVEILMMHDTGRTEDERRVLEPRREWWTVVEPWTLLPDTLVEGRTVHHEGRHPHPPHDRPDPPDPPDPAGAGR